MKQALHKVKGRRINALAFFTYKLKSVIKMAGTTYYSILHC